MKKDLSCPAGCKHEVDSETCKKWSWVVVHKDDWQLEMWQDGSLILGLSNSYSGVRAGILTRPGNDGDGGFGSFEVACPDGIHAYNIYGRSATDGHDQNQKKMNMSERRTVREGVKGGLFVIDVLFANGSIMQKDLVASTVAPWKLKKDYTKSEFCSRWSDQVLASAASLRRRRTGSMVLADVSQNTLNKLLSPFSSSSRSSAGCSSEGDIRSHCLLDMGQVARMERYEANPDGRFSHNQIRRGSSHGGTSGYCAYPSCDVEKPKRSQHAL